MTRYMLAAASAVLLSSQANAQIVITNGGYYQPVGVYSPFGNIVNTSGYYSGGYVSPYSSGYLSPYGNYASPYNSYYGGYPISPARAGYGTSYNNGLYNTGYYNSYRPAGGMYRGRGWR